MHNGGYDGVGYGAMKGMVQWRVWCTMEGMVQ